MSLLMLLNLSAAFDAVDHSIQLTLLFYCFCVEGIALKWFKLYLTGRSQTFVYDGNQMTSFSIECSVRQWSVMGPLCFFSFTEEITDLFDQHCVQSHIYADDNQLYASCRAEEVNATRDCLSNCTADITQWCALRHLQLIPDKTEAIWFRSWAALKKLRPDQRKFQIGSSTIQSSATVRDLGVHLDVELSMKQHISKTTAECYYHLHRLRRIR